MKRILLMVFRNILRVIPMWIKLCYMAAHPDKYTDEEHNKLFKYIVERANIGGNVTIKAYGQENIPKENGFMFFPNHQGMYDVLAIIDSCPNPLSVVYKIELKDVPFIKQIASCMKAFFIDRDDVRQSMKVIVAVADEVKKGRNYLIFPEGTRSKNGNNVGEFKGGSFKAATKTKCPIVPVALIDSFKPFDTNTTKPVDVQVHYLKPLYYEEYKDMKTNEIAEEVRRRIVEVIEKNKVD
ncbi:MAG: 1-acyl-sn-glycerol-3-phosphate acyltransferase [Tyzzerella sp.]|nr:1-acyl-sn-glycerol-3-phosphate acyltransferase [Tyzzerella sp.]